MSEVTQVLADLADGNPMAAEQLLPLVYHELRRLAAHRLARESPGQTLQPTALVHEAYCRLVSAEKRQSWKSRGHFFAAAAQAMRRILVERARRRMAHKHGLGWRRIDMNLDLLAEDRGADQLLALDQALKKLEVHDARKANLVELRFFCGLTADQAAAMLDVSVTTANRDWTYARAWLLREMADDGEENGRTDRQ